MNKYILSIDQSTQGTKALLMDQKGKLLGRVDMAHEQIVNELGWVSHNPEEIYNNTLTVAEQLIKQTGIDASEIIGVGISNQRETSVMWHKGTGKPLANAVVWQCHRAKEIGAAIEKAGHSDLILNHTGMPLSPYFPASKITWLLENVEGAKELAKNHEICHGTIDSWLVYKLTKEHAYKTDYSNASRTQLFNIHTLSWDKEICEIFGIDPENLPEVCDSDSCFGMTDFEGLLPNPVPICGVLGDSHGALFAQGCLNPGMVKATHGTGSSIMMNIGEEVKLSQHGVVTSLAWRMNGVTNYVFEGNINYTGAVITWLKDDVGLIESPGETSLWCEQACQDDKLYLVPAFTGLGAPYWDSEATGILKGITRTTGKAEIVRAGVECIAYQIADIVNAMRDDSGMNITELRVDGGPTKNRYLMQFESDIIRADVNVSGLEELSGAGAAYAAGFSLGLYTMDIFNQTERTIYVPKMEESIQQSKMDGWKKAVKSSLSEGKCE